ncbi:HNH endonuclease [Terribacillus saccharophilus]|uniref:Putative HNH nuclease YajD n=1 Tax=Terribacillus saccharophilus TaxID=361277 RepID=A0ABX4GTC7_9BACI|nr:hypothetical protein CHH50_18840 [Terribacillus saccharophilus]PAD98126.1 hypothetical protein CHH48_18955 [Terribacillus saccharophilus]
MAVYKKCKKVNCRKLIDYSSGEKFCPAHKGHDNRIYNQQRRREKKEYISFYSSASWRTKRENILRRDNYLCQDCLKKGFVTPATIVHHIIETSEDWSLRLIDSNLVSVCAACHNREHKK